MRPRNLSSRAATTPRRARTRTSSRCDEASTTSTPRLCTYSPSASRSPRPSASTRPRPASWRRTPSVRRGRSRGCGDSPTRRASTPSSPRSSCASSCVGRRWRLVVPVKRRPVWCCRAGARGHQPPQTNQKEGLLREGREESRRGRSTRDRAEPWRRIIVRGTGGMRHEARAGRPGPGRRRRRRPPIAAHGHVSLLLVSGPPQSPADRRTRRRRLRDVRSTNWTPMLLCLQTHIDRER
mmetsp:Transcript_19972/g.79638  ORF Transcript_19972/g.79638 Transcript_19972/m.79638 type:complete len:238 (+) Transcript_19972:187-900(+)